MSLVASQCLANPGYIKDLFAKNLNLDVWFFIILYMDKAYNMFMESQIVETPYYRFAIGLNPTAPILYRTVMSPQVKKPHANVFCFEVIKPRAQVRATERPTVMVGRGRGLYLRAIVSAHATSGVGRGRGAWFPGMGRGVFGLGLGSSSQ